MIYCLFVDNVTNKYYSTSPNAKLDGKSEKIISGNRKILTLWYTVSPQIGIFMSPLNTIGGFFLSIYMYPVLPVGRTKTEQLNTEKTSDIIAMGIVARKPCLQGFRQSKTQTSLLSYRDKLEN